MYTLRSFDIFNSHDLLRTFAVFLRFNLILFSLIDVNYCLLQFLQLTTQVAVLLISYWLLAGVITLFGYGMFIQHQVWSGILFKNSRGVQSHAKLWKILNGGGSEVCKFTTIILAVLIA